jgi:3-phenylpropionate/trans-cinnamate dioxygenase ferredoxin subunit
MKHGYGRHPVSELLEVCKENELKDGGVRVIKAGKLELLITIIGDKYYAVDNRCPHLGARLSQGKIKGTIITCPPHGSRFDLRDSSVVRWTDWSGIKLAASKLLRSPRPIATYPVKVEGGSIFVQV